MKWIDYRTEFLTMLKIASNVQNPLQYAMQSTFWQRRNKKGNLPRGLPIASAIHNWSYPFNVHSKNV